MTKLGIVVIGRNEGERLIRCLRSAIETAEAVVYVDSGSTDQSVENASNLGVRVVLLDTAVPFTAARARNAGFDQLMSAHPDVEYVQFVDGDCEIVKGWLDVARRELDARPDTAVVCGRCRERFPERSIYNRLCDIEWDTPVGEARASGGNAMMRAGAFVAVGGFNPVVIAAEDDEICLRLRHSGWKVFRLDAEMVLHDAAMTRFSQWWKRARRCGYAYALGAQMHGAGPERHFVREERRAILWGGVVPAVSLVCAIPTFGLSLLLFGLYPLQFLRTYRGLRRRVPVRRHALAYAASCVLAKFPELIGILRCKIDRYKRRPARIIEHK